MKAKAALVLLLAISVTVSGAAACDDNDEDPPPSVSPTVNAVDWDLPDPAATTGWDATSTTGGIGVLIPPGWNWSTDSSPAPGSPEWVKLSTWRPSGNGEGREPEPGDAWVDVAIGELPFDPEEHVLREGTLTVRVEDREVVMLVRETESAQFGTRALTFARLEEQPDGLSLVAVGVVYLPADDATKAALLSAVATASVD
jgi:hypothetical protein